MVFYWHCNLICFYSSHRDLVCCDTAAGISHEIAASSYKVKTAGWGGDASSVGCSTPHPPPHSGCPPLHCHLYLFMQLLRPVFKTFLSGSQLAQAWCSLNLEVWPLLQAVICSALLCMFDLAHKKQIWLTLNLYPVFVFDLNLFFGHILTF